MMILAEMLILSEIMSIAGKCKSTPQGAKTITTQPRIKFSPHHCALLSVPIYARVLASRACPRAAHKTATYRNHRSSTGSADAIGWRKSNLTS
jgi:hypothetical protein